MKLIAALSLVLLSIPAFADVEIKINSFRPVGNMTSRPLVAELCGVAKCTGDGCVLPKFVTATVDYESNDAGQYGVVVNPNGSFCHAVVTWDGTVKVTTW